MKGVILFTDMVKSSHLWDKYDDKMVPYIKRHNKRIKKIAKRYKGEIIKNIGDSCMILFDTLDDSIIFAYSLQKIMKKRPIIIKEISKNKLPSLTVDKLQIRIGLAYGPLYEMRNAIQNCKLKDYLGNTVNVASRMESILSEPEGFAFTIIINNYQDIFEYLSLDILSFLKKYTNTKIHVFENTNVKNIRSGRLLQISNNIEYNDVKKLKSVSKLIAFSCTCG
jgi:hypothetical protein